MEEREQRIRENQLRLLQNVFDNWMPPTPAFKSNHEGVPEGCVPYISTSDVHDYNYIIRAIPSEVFFSHDDESYEKKENGEIIARYDSLEDLVADGWRLD